MQDKEIIKAVAASIKAKQAQDEDICDFVDELGFTIITTFKPNNREDMLQLAASFMAGFVESMAVHNAVSIAIDETKAKDVIEVTESLMQVMTKAVMTGTNRKLQRVGIVALEETLDPNKELREKLLKEMQ